MQQLNKKTRVIIQGITGHQGRFHAKAMKAFGTHIVAGVTPGKGGEYVAGVPVYNSVKEAVAFHPADFSVLFVPASHVKQAAYEALDNLLNLVIVTEHVPVHDTIEIIKKAKEKRKMVVGPNTAGLVIPGGTKLGIMPNNIFLEGDVGVVSRSGTLTYEIINNLSKAGLGQSCVVGIGGDPVIGSGFIQLLTHFQKDVKTRAIVLVGEIGGTSEIEAANYITKYVHKPVVAYIAGTSAKPGKKMGHAGAIVGGEKESAAYKIKYLEKMGIPVATLLSDIPKLLKKN